MRARGDEPLDISDDRWGETTGVLRGLLFENVILKDTKVRPTFVECQFHGCQFSNVGSAGRFWGALNLWTDCSFSGVEISAAISPQNRFQGCVFSDVYLKRYEPSETAFVSCEFDRLKIEALRAKPNMRNRNIRRRIRDAWEFPEIDLMDDQGVSVLFDRCRFESPEFRNCRFAHVRFSRSRVESPQVVDSEFSGASSESPWWDETGGGDVDEAYKNALIEAVEGELGRDSWTFGKLQECGAQYRGRDFRMKWSGMVIDAGIPDAEYDALERIIDRLRDRFA